MFYIYEAIFNSNWSVRCLQSNMRIDNCPIPKTTILYFKLIPMDA